MERADKSLAFMLQYENIAWYEDGRVKILDRRVYPREIKYVVCENHHEVTQALKDMVTQSAGPYTAAAVGMALAANECRDKTEAEQRAYLRDAAFTIAHARPTPANRIYLFTGGGVVGGVNAVAGGFKVSVAIMA
jgi:methylthioribose-1-phosphate isomerase